ncbi:acid-activated periplasmic chaperone HdeA [Bordetella sp. 15P40C-2]|uniref:acid-activated periplasmic chaperone HdeA n=1 Tax=Bordetella sp. 15P40C-2 TaxID=2572246 RepID=UPI001323D71E|nr:acid-activated periplasmic chaperone HdeA [Bordetella sp. 15P40C-2]MVW71956.1 acid-resistance protein [Bordetella sp. 15P40C-2]
MKKVIFAVAVAGLAAFSATTHADTKQPVPLWLCSDYLTLDESVRPTALGFAAAVNHNGDVQKAVVDVEGIAKVQPQLLTYCKENPKVALRDALVGSGVVTKK